MRESGEALCQVNRDNAAADSGPGCSEIAFLPPTSLLRVHEEVPFPGYGVAAEFIRLRFVVQERVVSE